MEQAAAHIIILQTFTLCETTTKSAKSLFLLASTNIESNYVNGDSFYKKVESIPATTPESSWKFLIQNPSLHDSIRLLWMLSKLFKQRSQQGRLNKIGYYCGRTEYGDTLLYWWARR